MAEARRQEATGRAKVGSTETHQSPSRTEVAAWGLA